MTIAAKPDKQPNFLRFIIAISFVPDRVAWQIDFANILAQSTRSTLEWRETENADTRVPATFATHRCFDVAGGRVTMCADHRKGLRRATSLYE
jgi:hypothetical protein